MKTTPRVLRSLLNDGRKQAFKITIGWSDDAVKEAWEKFEHLPSIHQSARLYVAQALVILDHKKSKAYHHAHDYLHEAKILFEQADEMGTWSAWVEIIRREHKLKSSFMPDFEVIVAGKGPIREPSFMERIADKLDGG